MAVARVGVGAQVQRVFAEQVVFEALHAAIVQVLLALGGIGLERLDDLVLALVQGLLGGLLDVERDQQFVVGRRAVALDTGVVQPGAVHGLADIVGVGLLRELHIHQRAAAEINAQREVVPEQHGENPRHAEHQREGQEVPLLPQEVDVRIFEEFHV